MKKLISAVCAAIFFAVQTVFCSAAVPADITEELFALNMRERNAESFFDGLQAGSADWTAFCYGRLYGAENADGYIEQVKQAADQLVHSEGFVTPTELQRTAVLLSAFGECPQELINAAAYDNPNLDKQGLNAWVWALIAANCGNFEHNEDILYTRLQLAEGVIERQLTDGGFALRGESADADMTAAAIIALAPLGDNEDVRGALDKAVSALSDIQLESGGFSSLGTETSESTSQAVIAFTAAGIADERLERAVSALLKFRSEDGGFSHELNGRSDKMSTSQALQAFAALELSKRGERLFDKPTAAEADEIAPEASEIPENTDTTQAPDTSDNSAEKDGLTGFHIKLIISGALAAVGMTVVLIGAARRKSVPRSSGRLR